MIEQPGSYSFALTSDDGSYLEIDGLLDEAGLEPVSGFSSLAEDPFKLGAHRLLLVSEKQ